MPPELRDVYPLLHAVLFAVGVGGALMLLTGGAFVLWSKALRRAGR